VQKHEITYRMVRLIESNHSSTFFLNGPPGSGKSHFLETLAKELPLELQRVFILGPYHIINNRVNDLCGKVIQDCTGAGFIAQEKPCDLAGDLVGTWNWFANNLQISVKQTFIVLIDLGCCSADDITDVGDLFSSVRHLEGIWNSPNVRVHHLLTGYWDHPALEKYFDQINTSFPYTVGHNYFTWTGISPEEMNALVKQRYPTDSQIPFGQVLYELTNGHPGAALDILNRISGDKLSFSSLLTATYNAALEGQMSQVLLELMSQLPIESKSVLREMMFQRRIPAITFTPELECLYLAGIICKIQVGKQGYIDYQSWYVELLVHLHAERLGISDSQFNKLDIDEFMPRTSIMNVEAFRVINETENLTRNYISVQLCLRVEPGFHYLMGRARKYNPEKQIEEDAYQRAEDWQNRSADRGLSVELNPLIAYLSTRDLANLIEELGAEMRLSEWLRIAQAIRTLSDVRDAVMHNQLIDDVELEHLYELQADVFNALSKQSS
jgi:hypothetical protein